MRGLPVVFSALLAQIGGLASSFLAFKAAAIFGLLLPLWGVVSLQSAISILLTRLLGLPFWWWPMQGLFAPALLFTLSLKLPPGLFLAGFILLCLIFLSNAKERIPLYLSNEATCQALAELMPKGQPCRLIDLGCGLGGLLANLSGRKPDSRFDGVETAPIPFLVSWLRLRKKGNAQVRYRNLWNENLAAYDVVYAFLSPEPMPELWRKAKKEMRTGSLFVSNSFAVPGCEPARTVQLADSRRTRLYVWEI